MNRAEHVAWCKQRALEYIERGELREAFDSMCSDLLKHEDTRGRLGMELGMMLMMNGHLGTPEKMPEFIEGFN
jgi:hypothetical protein